MTYPNAYPTITPNDITLQPGATYSLTDLFTYHPAVGNTGDPIAYVAGFTSSLTYGYTLTGTLVEQYNYYSYTMEGDAAVFGPTFGGTQPFSDGTIHVDAGWTDPITISFSFNVGFYNSDQNNYPWFTGTVSGGAGTFAVGPPSASFSIADAAPVTEGPDATASFIVSLSQALSYPVTVNYATHDGTALAGQDYTNSTGTLTFQAGQTSQTISVPITNDNVPESDENFSVVLSDAAGTGGAAPQISKSTGLEVIHDPIQVSVQDAFITEGASGETNYIAFKVELSAPILQGSLVVNLSEINPAADPLKLDQLQYMDASPATGDIIYPLPSPLSVTFDANSGTVQELRIPIAGDNLIEPDEKFTIKITAPAFTQDGRLVNVTDDVAIGTIYNDDGNNNSPKAVVTWAAPQEIPDDLRAYVTADIEAAVARLDVGLGGRLPTLEVAVQPYDLPSGYLAAGIPVFTHPISGLRDDGGGKSAKSLTMVLPLASYEKLTGTDLNAGGPDLKIFVDLDELKKIYSGGSTSVDGTSLMLHEIMHGLGFGVPGRAQYTTPWYHYELQSPTGLYFVGPEATKVAKQGVQLTTDDGGAHLHGNDLMDQAGVQPNETLSSIDLAILSDLGYGKKAPMWWTDHKATVPTGVDEPNVPSAFAAESNFGEGGNFAFHHSGWDWALL